jgi:hypothetical protein
MSFFDRDHLNFACSINHPFDRAEETDIKLDMKFSMRWQAALTDTKRKADKSRRDAPRHAREYQITYHS